MIENIPSIKEIDKLSNEKKIETLTNIKNQCLNVKCKNFSFGQKVLSHLNSHLRNFEIEIRNAYNLPNNDKILFVINHSNSHDGFTMYEICSIIGKPLCELVASDSLNALSSGIFKMAGSVLIDRNDKFSSRHSIIEISSRILSGSCGAIFAESTWNLHPCKPMQNLKPGFVEVAAITDVVIVPTIFEYIESPKICNSEKELYEKLIVTFGDPITVDKTKSFIEQSSSIQQIMIEMRKSIWKEFNISKDISSLEWQDIYINHLYAKKFLGTGFEFDSDYELPFLFFNKNEKAENEYCMDNGNFIPGTLKKGSSRKVVG